MRGKWELRIGDEDSVTVFQPIFKTDVWNSWIIGLIINRISNLWLGFAQSDDVRIDVRVMFLCGRDSSGSGVKSIGATYTQNMQHIGLVEIAPNVCSYETLKLEKEKEFKS